jgi:hypothetical protein
LSSMKFIFIFLLHFGFTFIFSYGFAQEIVSLRVVCTETNAPVEVSVILAYPSGKIYLTNDDGYAFFSKSEFETTDSVQISHLSYIAGSFKKEDFESTGKDDYIIRLEQVNYVFSELIIKPVNTKKLVEGFTRLFDLRKVMSYTNARGFFSNHIMQGDSLLGFFVSDILIFHGGVDSLIYTKDFFELSTSTMSAVHLNAITSETYANQPCETEPLFDKKRLKFGNLGLVEKYLFLAGPLNQKYRKFYRYTIDSVYSNDGVQMFKVAFEPKNTTKSRTKVLTGRGFIKVDEMNVVHSVEVFDAFFPLKYYQRIQMKRFDELGYKNHYILHYKPTHKGLFPVFIQYSGIFENGYKEYATMNLYQVENIVNFTNNNYYSLTLGLISFENAPFLFYDLENWRKRWDLFELYGAKGFQVENPADYQVEMERMQGLIFNECEDLISFPDRYTKVKQIYEEYIINSILKTINKTGL